MYKRFLLPAFALILALPIELPAGAIEHGPGLTGKYSMKVEGFYLHSLKPKGQDAPTESNLVTEARGRLFYTPTPSVHAYFDGRLNLRRRNRDDGIDSDTDYQADLEVKELWLEKTDIVIPASYAKIGRSKLLEPRGWWWDDEFESLRSGYDTTLLKTELGIGQRLTQTRINEDERLNFEGDITWLFGTVSHQWRAGQFLEGRLLFQMDDNQNAKVGDILKTDAQRNQDNDLVWIGARLTGEESFNNALDKIRYWVDLAYVTGSEERLVTTTTATQQEQVTAIRDEDVDGFAFDVGLTAQPDAIPGAAVTLSYAYAPGDSDNTGYRQPLLHRNKAKFSGFNRFRTYGEVLRPNLSNLHIITAAFGYPLGHNSWLESVYHYYRQDDSSREILDSRLRINPDGRDTDIGHAFDFILGNNLAKGMSYELVAGTFIAGSAFNTSDDLAYRIAFKLRYDF